MTFTIPVEILWMLGAIAAWWACGFVILTLILAMIPGMALGLPRSTIRAMRWGGPVLLVFAILMVSDMHTAKRMRKQNAQEREAAGLADEPRIF